MTFEISGEYNTATVFTNQSKSEAETEAVEQIEEMANSEAFIGDNNISIMPDFHWGSGAVIGFTMPVKDRVVPNTIGVDIGCGMLASNFGKVSIDLNENQKLGELDAEIRSRVPTGFDVHNRNDYHIIDDFPWHVCARKLADFEAATDFELTKANRYGGDYFTDLCERIGYDATRAINSVGTLGGGNHFIELGTDESGDLWTVIHSGSRGIGATIAQYWQDRATEHTTTRQSIEDVPESVREYMGEDWKPLADKIRSDFSGKDIQNKFDEVSQAIGEYGPSTSDRNTDLDYLKNEEAHGYIIDMIFAQTYASESRREMMQSVQKALSNIATGLTKRIEILDTIESVHNYIDFEDGVIRKGACRAESGERLVVPFNMSYGTIIAEGLGRDEWNSSSAHGAGRAMSRTEAKDRFTDSDFTQQTQGVYMSKNPMDEIPGAYKDPSMVEDALGENVDIVNRISPILSIKAE